MYENYPPVTGDDDFVWAVTFTPKGLEGLESMTTWLIRPLDPSFTAEDAKQVVVDDHNDDGLEVTKDDFTWHVVTHQRVMWR